MHYDRDFGHEAFGAVRDRGFEDRPYDLHGVDRSRDDQHMSGYDRDFGPRYDRDMRGYSRQDMDLGDRPRGWGRGWNRERWEGRPRGWDYGGGD